MASQEMEKIRSLPEVDEPVKLFSILQSELEKMQNAMGSTGTGGAAKVMRKLKLMVSNKKKTQGVDISGNRIAEYFPTKRVMDCVNQLIVDPTDSQARLALLEPFALKGIKGNLIVYREVFLHAMIEAGSKKISSHKFNVALMAQRRYLDKLAEYFKDEIANAQSKMAEAKKDQKAGAVFDQIENFKKYYSYVKELTGICKSKQINQMYETDLKTILTEKPDKDQINNILSPMLGIAVATPLLRPTAEALIDSIKKIATNTPLGAFYEARMLRIWGKILMAQYSIGDKSQANECAKYFVNSLNIIGNTMSVVGDHPNSKIDKACIQEFGLTCFAVFQNLPTLGVVPPKNLFQQMESAIKMLSKISDEPGAIEVQNALGKAMMQQKGIKS